jgi:hypothetical protein
MSAETCAGCRHRATRWRTFRMVSYCTRYRVERNVRCLVFNTGGKANGKAKQD